jgi:hypothetical protein
MLAWSDNWMDEFILGPIDQGQHQLVELCREVFSCGCIWRCHWYPSGSYDCHPSKLAFSESSL